MRKEEILDGKYLQAVVSGMQNIDVTVIWLGFVRITNWIEK